jgi:hypothetical protein
LPTSSINLSSLEKSGKRFIGLISLSHRPNALLPISTVWYETSPFSGLIPESDEENQIG